MTGNSYPRVTAATAGTSKSSITSYYSNFKNGLTLVYQLMQVAWRLETGQYFSHLKLALCETK